MHLIKEWKLNLRTTSEANNTDHWTKKAARKKLQQHIIKIAWLKDPPSIQWPCKVRLIRIASRGLDVGDNLPMAFKGIRDFLADLMLPGLAPGIADSSPMIEWEYDQKKGSPMGIIVQFWVEHEKR